MSTARIRAVLTTLLHELDPLAGPAPVTGAVFADAVQVIGAVAAAARRRPGVAGTASPWQYASALASRLTYCLLSSRNGH